MGGAKGGWSLGQGANSGVLFDWKCMARKVTFCPVGSTHSRDGYSLVSFPVSVPQVELCFHYTVFPSQKQHGGPATECCLKHVGSCGGPAGVCVFFYDCAPSGRYGTMSYLAQAVADQLRGMHKPTDECKIS